MTVARHLQLDATRPTWVHCVSRCVRRAYLCGFDHTTGVSYEYRKQWIEQRLRLLAQTAACEVASYAVMSNHLHVVVRMRPDVVKGWSARSVVERWLTIWPRQRRVFDEQPDNQTTKQRDEQKAEQKDEVNAATPTIDAETQQTVLVNEQEMARLIADEEQVAKWRERLADLSWMMRALKEPISRRANAEDGCSGTFWQGRFKSIPLLDQAALLACMVYVDLNPIRAGVVDRVEKARFTSAYERIRVRKIKRRAAELRRNGQSERSSALLAQTDLVDELTIGVEEWLTPIESCLLAVDQCVFVGEGEPRLQNMSENDYLRIVDGTGRFVQSGQESVLPGFLIPVLERLDIDYERWRLCMFGHQQFLGSAVGCVSSRLAEAKRRVKSWLQNRCLLFAS